MDKNITVPMEFFIKERKNAYSHWQTAFVRELLSNSLDAGATRINIQYGEVSEAQNGVFYISDNGTGMSREICEDVYLALGRSTKDGSSTIGGFGRARILTCFSMNSYRLRSAEYMVIGQGSKYGIQGGFAPIEGLELTIYPSSSEDWQTHINDVLSQSQFPDEIEIRVNNQLHVHESNYRIEAGAEPLEYDGKVYGDIRLFRSLTFDGKLGEATADLLTKHPEMRDNFKEGFLYCRINGMCMFVKHVNIRGSYLIVDLIPELSREILTGNRDNFKGGLDQHIMSKVRPFEIEGIKKQTPHAVLRTLYYLPEGSGPFMCGSTKNFTPEWGYGATTSVRDGEIQIASGADAPEGLTINKGYSKDFPMIIHFDLKDVNNRAAAEAWLPDVATPMMKALYIRWVEMVHEGMQVLQSITKKDYAYITGLCFLEKVEGQHQVAEVNGYYTHAILFNPLDSMNFSKVLYGFRAEDQQRLLALALHEVVHCECTYHDQDYANLLTEVFGRISLRNMQKLILP